jgi:hypothetical protein
MSQISQVAYQCPLKSASAVFKAREMYAIDHPLANFDNYAICSNQASSPQYKQVSKIEFKNRTK